MNSSKDIALKCMLSCAILAGFAYVALNPFIMNESPVSRASENFINARSPNRFAKPNESSGYRLNDIQTHIDKGFSKDTPEVFMKDFIKRHQRKGISIDYKKADKQHAIVHYRDHRGQHHGMLAFKSQSGGTRYYLGQTRDKLKNSSKAKAWPDFGFRELFYLDNAHSKNSMAFYESPLNLEDTSRRIDDDMIREGWKRDTRMDEALKERELEGLALYRRNRLECMVGVSNYNQKNHVSILLKE